MPRIPSLRAGCCRACCARVGWPRRRSARTWPRKWSADVPACRSSSAHVAPQVKAGIVDAAQQAAARRSLAGRHGAARPRGRRGLTRRPACGATGARRRGARHRRRTRSPSCASGTTARAACAITAAEEATAASLAAAGRGDARRHAPALGRDRRRDRRSLGAHLRRDPCAGSRSRQPHHRHRGRGPAGMRPRSRSAGRALVAPICAPPSSPRSRR